MDGIQVSDEGLRTLAARCAAISAQLAEPNVAPVPGPQPQSTPAAVASVYPTVNATSATLAKRVDSTGAKVASAATRYVTQDDGNAQQISAVGQSIQA